MKKRSASKGLPQSSTISKIENITESILLSQLSKNKNSAPRISGKDKREQFTHSGSITKDVLRNYLNERMNKATKDEDKVRISIHSARK